MYTDEYVEISWKRCVECFQKYIPTPLFHLFNIPNYLITSYNFNILNTKGCISMYYILQSWTH